MRKYNLNYFCNGIDTITLTKRSKKTTLSTPSLPPTVDLATHFQVYIDAE